MLYSILICTRNRCQTLAEALKSHTAISVPTGITREMIVVDNGSTDATSEVVESFRESSGLDVKYIQEKRQGHSIALNTGCKAAAGDYIVFTDDDAFPDSEWLLTIHETLKKHDADWVYGPVVPCWESGKPPEWYGPHTLQLVACIDYGPDEFIATDVSQTFFGVNHACRRSKLFELGLWREDLGLLPGGKSFTGNDDELFARALRANCKLVYHPKILVNHLIAEQRTSKQFHRNNAVLLGKNMYHALSTTIPECPTFAGLPRFYYRKPFEHIAGWIKSFFIRNQGLRMYHELHFLRFTSSIYHALSSKIRMNHKDDHT